MPSQLPGPPATINRRVALRARSPRTQATGEQEPYRPAARWSTIGLQGACAWRSSSAAEQGTHKPLAGSSNLPSATTKNDTGAASAPVLLFAAMDYPARVGSRANSSTVARLGN